MNRPTISAVQEAPPNVRHRTPFDSPLSVVKFKRLANRQAARLSWSEHWHGGCLNVVKGLTERQYLLIVQWATGVLLQQLAPDGDGYARNGAVDLTHEQLLAVESNLDAAQLAAGGATAPAWGDQTVVCLDCGEKFDPDSSPHPDRCWIDAERADAEAGR